MIDQRLDVLLREMHDAAREAQGFVADMSLDAFLTNALAQNAVAMTMVRIGEAATRLIQDYAVFTLANPEIRWSSLRGVRNLIAHAYHALDFVILWQIVIEHLPPLVEWLDAMLEPRVT